MKKTKTNESLTESCRRAVEMFRNDLIDKVFRSFDHIRLVRPLGEIIGRGTVQEREGGREREREREREGERSRQTTI